MFRETLSAPPQSVLLDEAAGVKSTQEPVLPNTELLQRGTAEVASWNTKRVSTPTHPHISHILTSHTHTQASVRTAVNSYSFIHAKVVERPQLRFKCQADNSSSPFIPLLRDKTNAKSPLPDGNYTSTQRTKLNQFLIFVLFGTSTKLLLKLLV